MGRKGPFRVGGRPTRELHWIVEVLHLAISMASMVWGRWLLSSIRQRRVAGLGLAA